MIDESILLQHNAPVVQKTRFLDSSHLRDDIKTVVVPFENLGAALLQRVPSSSELTLAIQKLVEAKDQAVRAYLHAIENDLRHYIPGASSGQPTPSDATSSTTQGNKF